MIKQHKLDFLTAIYIFCLAAAELMGGKIFRIVDIPGLQLNASVGIFLIPVIFTINDMITEVYGKERTRSIIRSGLFVIFLVMIFSVFATQLEPASRFAESEAAYDSVFSKSARIAFASLTAFALAEFLDVFVYVRIRQRFGGRRLWLRNNLSNFISQFTDTVIFMTVAFYAFDKPLGENIPFLVSLILPYWILKCIMSVIETPFVYLGVRWLRDTGQSPEVDGQERRPLHIQE